MTRAERVRMGYRIKLLNLMLERAIDRLSPGVTREEFFAKIAASGPHDYYHEYLALYRGELPKWPEEDRQICVLTAYTAFCGLGAQATT